METRVGIKVENRQGTYITTKLPRLDLTAPVLGEDLTLVDQNANEYVVLSGKTYRFILHQMALMEKEIGKLHERITVSNIMGEYR